MTSIAITEMGENQFGVEIDEGDQHTGRIVTVPPALIDDLYIPDVDQEVIVRESVAFLLDREPAASIGDLSLDEIPRRHPDYYDELKARIGET